MLAYLLWHSPADTVEHDAYERACERFHRSLAHTSPAGLRGSAVYRVHQTPWLGDCYEDWYLVEDFTALGVLNEAAVAHAHRAAHDEVARRFGTAAGGLYRLLEGNIELAAARVAAWVARPPGAPPRALGELLGDGLDPGHASLWRRQLVLGPAPEYCLLADTAIPARPPTGLAATRLAPGWRATVTDRELVWCD